MRPWGAVLLLALLGCSEPPPEPAPSPPAPVAQSYEDRFKETADKAKVFEADVNDALERGDYSTALDGIDKAETVWKTNGFQTLYHQQRIEAFLGLKRYDDLLKLAGPERKPGDAMTSCAVALALLETGKPAEARKMYAEQYLLQHLPPLSRRVLPPIKTDSQFRAALHTTRGVEMYFAGNAPVSARELLKAEDIQPGQPLNSYFLGKLLLLKGDTARAKGLLRKGSTLPGSLGLEAKQLAK